MKNFHFQEGLKNCIYTEAPVSVIAALSIVVRYDVKPKCAYCVHTAGAKLRRTYWGVRDMTH